MLSSAQKDDCWMDLTVESTYLVMRLFLGLISLVVGIISIHDREYTLLYNRRLTPRLIIGLEYPRLILGEVMT